MSNEDTLAERLSFIKIGPETVADIRSVKSLIMRDLPGALDNFYAQVQAFPHTKRFFTDQAHMGAAKKAQLSHWDAIASGRFDQDYAREVTAVGKAHARTGLEPRWYIAGYALILESLVAGVLQARWPKSGFGAKRATAKQVAAELGAVIKAALLDMDLAISVYVETSQTTRKAADDRAVAATNEAVVTAVGDALGAIADGDLTYRMGDELPADYARLREDFNAALERLADTLSHVQANAGHINTGADEIAQASDDLSRRTEQQAASLEETAAALDEITATVKRTALGAEQANKAVSVANDVAKDSGEVVGQAVSAMSEIEKSSLQISQIIGVIDEIAFQTNLLALNAGVEAARAGDAGRGFAVVASEVRALAQRSADAAKEIKALISASSQQVGQGVNLVGKTGVALQSIIAKVTEIDRLVSEIASSAQEQSTGLHQVNTAVNQMDQITQQNAAMVEQSTAAAHSLKAETAELAQLVAAFRLGSSAQPAGASRRPADPKPATARSPVHAMNRKIAASFGAAAAPARPRSCSPAMDWIAKVETA
jgi:methyl-accepting chemotaxis protein